MEGAKTNLKIATGAVTILLLFSTAGNIYYWDKSRGLTGEKDKIEQKANALLLGQSLDIDELNKQVDRAKKKKNFLMAEVKELNGLLSRVNTDLWELRTGKANNTGNLDYVRSRNQTILSVLNNRTDQLAKENGTLAQQNNQMSQQIAVLKDSLQTITANTLTADGFRMVALKGNNKETAKAKKVDRLTVSFTVPAEVGLTGRQAIYLSLTDAKEIALQPALCTISIEERVIPVHAVKSVNFYEQKESITLTVHDSNNLKPGMYRAAIYSEDDYLGSVEVQFRDSFWFF